MNHLSGESSPYLRLHAPNPVEWYPWSEEAFARARTEDKPIFLSIGYYTCHWCHVMERESFSSPAVAALLSRDFISIKVDREERPDVDRLYMAYVQATTGGGGWPLSAFLTPELKPFYGGTYFPPRDLQNVPSFSRVLQSVAHAWREQRGKVMDAAAEISGYLAQSMQPQAAGPVPATAAALLEASWPRLWDNLRAGYDREAGGFGGAPKFQRPAVYHFLLRFARRRRGRPEAKEAIGMVTHTLRAMAGGGIHDALGGGFHRYAVDANWRVPHFEKMLYDQAQLATAYLEAWQVTHAADLAQAARSTLDYVLREMTAPEGGFYSAEDADSPLPEAQRHPGGPGEGEGAYYLWTQEEIFRLLDGATAQRFIKSYGLRPEGNVPAGLDPQGEFSGKNILYGAGTPELEAARAALYQARRQRPHPPRDEKVLAAWNGLMISALALGARALDTADAPRYLAAARSAAGFFRAQRWHAEAGELRRTPAIGGFVEDYAFLIQGLLDLYQADFDPGWLEWAAELQRAQDARFAAPGGGYYSSSEDPHLWMRMREEYDGAEPSPNSVAARNLQRLSLWFERDGWRDAAHQLLASFAQRLEQAPETLPLMAATLEAAAVPPRRLLIAGAPQAPATRALLRVVRQRFLPEYDVMLDPAANAAPAAYLCRDYTCQRPVTDAEALDKSLDLSAE